MSMTRKQLIDSYLAVREFPERYIFVDDIGKLINELDSLDRRFTIERNDTTWKITTGITVDYYKAEYSGTDLVKVLKMAIDGLKVKTKGV